MKQYLAIFGLVVMWTATATLLGLILYSWSSPIGYFTATTNTMHERTLETVLLSISLIIGLFVIKKYVLIAGGRK